MSEWKEHILADIARLKKDSWKVGDELSPYIGLEHIEENKLRLNDIGSSEEVGSNKYRFKKGDILFGKLRPYFRKVVKPDFDGICSTDIWVIQPKGGVDADFLFYFFANEELVDLSFASSSGTRMPRADWDFLKGTEWPLPPLQEQKAIASVLSSLDDKIDLLHRQNQTLEAMAETLFRQWFVEEAREDWEEGELGDILHLEYGKGLKKSDRTGHGYPVIGSSGIIDYHNEYLVEAPGIVIGRKGTLGETIYLADNFHPIDTTYYITSKINIKGLYYEYFLLKSIGFENMNSDSAVPGLNRDMALATELLIPPKKLIRKFSTVVEPMFKKIEFYKNQINHLEKLRDLSLPKLVNGEIRVS